MGKQVDFYHIQEPAGDRTPAHVFEHIQGRNKAMLESSYQHVGKGMYSFICSDPILELSSMKHETTVFDPTTGESETYKGDALQYINHHIPKISLPIDVPFYSGFIGYVGYDAVRSYVHIGERKDNQMNMPDMHLMLYTNVIVFDHSEHVIHYIAVAYDDEPLNVLEKRVYEMKKSIQTPMHAESYCPPLQFEETENKETFLKQVRDVQQLIDEHTFEQIVLSKRFVTKGIKHPFSYYKKLRKANPSPYMFYIEYEAYTLFGASPESVVQTNGNSLITNPIAGTSPRGETAEEDAYFKIQLLQNKKELHEHNMLVELSKREMEELCTPDSITVPMYQAVEMYEYVMHIVSKVQGTLRDEYSSIDALIHCLPAGTVSGTPKEDAMCVINRYESTSRGVYGGVVGYINTAFDMNMVLAIRLMTVLGEYGYVQAGAGIVSESIPEKEYEEIYHKVRSFISI